MFSHVRKMLAIYRCQDLKMNCITLTKYLNSSPASFPIKSVFASYSQGTTKTPNTEPVFEETASEKQSTSDFQFTVSDIDVKNMNSLPDSAQMIYTSIESQLKKHNNIKILAKEECQKVLQLLISLKIPKENIEDVLTKVPVLLTYTDSIWEKTVKKLLTDYQFNPSQLLPVIADSPFLMDGTGWKSLYDVFVLLRGWGIGEGRMQTVVLKNPDILHKSTKYMLGNYSNICSVFTKGDSRSLILSNPNILTDEWETTESKIQYVYEKMGLKSPQIVKSNLFKHSLLHIIARHEFLERAGLYSMPDKRGISKTDNPPLRHIVDSTDQAFAKVVAGLTENEYAVFREMKELELEEDKELEEAVSDDELSD